MFFGRFPRRPPLGAAGVMLALAVAFAPQPARAAGAVHVVAPGESLSVIAHRYGLAIGALQAANHLPNPHLIRAGQRLEVPVPNIDPRLPGRLRAVPERLRLRPVFAKWANANGLPSDLLEAMAWLESGWNQTKISSTGAIGIGQIMPDTARFVTQELIGKQLDVHHPHDNIRMSARMLRFLLVSTNGDVRMALCGYYQGLRSMRRNGVYPQTRRYAADVLALRRQFPPLEPTVGPSPTRSRASTDHGGPVGGSLVPKAAEGIRGRALGRHLQRKLPAE